MSKPVIAAVDGPPVAGGMELALWCDCRIMADTAYFGVYCRRWGIPLLDGGAVRLPRLIGQGRALEIIMTAAKCQPRKPCASAYASVWWAAAPPGKRRKRWRRKFYASRRPLCAQTDALCTKATASDTAQVAAK